MSEATGARGAERSFNVLIATSLLAPLLLFLGASYFDFRKEKADAIRQVVSTADAMAEHAQKVIETSQLVQTLVADRVRGIAWDRMHEDADLHSFLQRLANALPQIDSTFLVAPDGTIAASSRAFPMAAFDVSEREYVQAARAGERGMVISAPFRGRLNGNTAFTASRPVDPAEPSGGLVAVTLSPDYFLRFYAALAQTGADPRASLLRRDGTFLVRYPAGNSPVRLPEGSVVTVEQIGTQVSGQLEGAARPGESARLIAFHQLATAPLVAIYSVSLRDALGDWYRHVAVLAAFALGLAGVLAYSTRAAMRRTAEEQRSLRLLLAETTRREQAEDAMRQLQKMDALGRLTGGVAHDFNNLLTAVMGAIELAGKRVDDPRVTRLLGGAMDAARRGARLTQQMLAVSRQQDVRLGPVAVNEALRAMDEMLTRALGPDVVVEHDLADGLWPATADLTQLEVAVLNLAINARDAMPLGGTVRIHTANIAAGEPRPPGVPAGDMVMVGVRDSGTGMTDEVARRAVEPFFTTKEIGRGTGLGLSMVHGFARRAAGALVVDSAPDRGTTITMFLPRSREAAAAAAPPVPDAAPHPSRLVLVVDDDDAVRATSLEMLRELGHRVLEASNGQEALDLLRAEPQVALMLIDYAMPRMNGGEVARRARALRPDLPMVFVSGYTERDALHEWTARGYQLVAKPFTLPQLAAGVAAARAPAPLAQ